jgi:hypothetical protein
LVGFLDPDRSWNRLAGRNRSKCTLEAIEEIAPVEIANGDDERIHRMIVAVVMRVEVVSRDRAQIALVSDHHMPIRMSVERGPYHFLIQRVSGIVLGTLSLGEDHCPLGLDLVRCEE